MQFTPKEIDGNVMVIEVDGGLDGSNADAFTRDVIGMVEGGVSRLIIDCRHLTSLSSVGVGALIRLHKRAATQGGDVKLCSVPGIVMQVLSLMRMDRVFEIYPDLGRARLAFREGP